MKKYLMEFKAFIILYLVTICFTLTGFAMFSYQLWKWLFNMDTTFYYMTLGLKMVIISSIAIVIEFLIFFIITTKEAKDSNDEGRKKIPERDDHLSL